MSACKQRLCSECGRFFISCGAATCPNCSTKPWQPATPVNLELDTLTTPDEAREAADWLDQQEKV